jgi:hypothetical protein
MPSGDIPFWKIFRCALRAMLLRQKRRLCLGGRAVGVGCPSMDQTEKNSEREQMLSGLPTEADVAQCSRHFAFGLEPEVVDFRSASALEFCSDLGHTLAGKNVS